MTHHRSPGGRRSLRGAALGASLVLVAALAACGVPLDNTPHPITQATATTEVTTPVSKPSNGAPEVSVYFLNGDRLERQGIAVEGDPTLDQALDFVLSAPSGGDLTTAVPPDTTLRSVDVTDGIATIDLTDQINDVNGPAQKQAFAQIVFTALAFPNVKQVQFRIDGEVIDAPTDDGNLSVVSAENYDKPLNPR